jgi:hypothetical protein
LRGRARDKERRKRKEIDNTSRRGRITLGKRVQREISYSRSLGKTNYQQGRNVVPIIILGRTIEVDNQGMSL